MPNYTHIKSILVIGSGPIKIGQACEFDYSGTQALKALREEGKRIILINSNPATIMTDTELADATYMEPVTPEYVAQVIEKERPDALIATLGGQTSLNCALALHENGILEKFQVELLGASINTIRLAEDRTLFHNKMKEIGLDIPKSFVAHNKNEALHAMASLGLPVIVRTSFSLGGSGAAVVYTESEAIELFNTVFSKPQCQQITLDEGLFGWKEFELEVVRDKKDNCIVVCGVENFDPLGIHTGDSITVAPIQTLTDHEYQMMRNAAFAVLRAVGVETGGSNVQFAINPKTGRMVVIEMNPRVSRSSALVSKATGFPIAKIAAKLAIGYTLDELQNDITDGNLPASFEPSIDYTIIKIPRFVDEKFNAEHLPLGPQMRSVGEIMAIGSTFAESLQHAICSLDTQMSGFDSLPMLTDQQLKSLLTSHTSIHLWIIAESFRRGFSIEDIHAASFIDLWFLHQIKNLITLEQGLLGSTLHDFNKETLLRFKKNGFSDERIALLTNSTEKNVREYRQKLNIIPVYKCIDSCAGEFKTATAYLYSTYQEYCESKPSLQKKILIVGSGPNRIGQGIEFDYVCVKAIEAFAKAGFETIMINCNPETVSTDYDVANKLYFVPINHEKILDIIEKEKPDAVALQFGGQTPLNLLETLEQSSVPLIGLNADVVNLTEDRDQFRTFLQQLNLKQPANHIIHHVNELDNLLPLLCFPLIIRPSFILGGRGMEVIMDESTLHKQLTVLFGTNSHPILIEEFLQGAIELDVDAISDGVEVFIPAVLEHIEAAGVHSGDSACITPPFQLPEAIIQLIHHQTKKIAIALQFKGLMNIQFAVKGSDVYVIEVNPRASRTMPFVCKATGIPIVDIAINCMLGVSLSEQKCLSPVDLPYYCVKEAVLPFHNFASSSSPILGPEMKATGEVMGIGNTPHEAFLKAEIAAGHQFIAGSTGQVLVSGMRNEDVFIDDLKSHGFSVVFELDSENPPDLMIIMDSHLEYLSFAIQQHISYISTREAARMMVACLCNNKNKDIALQSLQTWHQLVKHPSKTRHLLSGRELGTDDILAILKLASSIKKNPADYCKALAGKNLVMIFEKPSFRTRLSFTLAMENMGGTAIESISNTRKQEEPQDLIRVLNSYSDVVMVRTHDDNCLQEMAKYSTQPIINGLSALHHPCQILADILSLQECFGKLDGLTLAYVGDGNNILHSFLLMAPLVGIKINYCCPAEHQPDSEILLQSKRLFDQMITACSTPEQAVQNAHAVYTDVWTSMGFEQQKHDNDFHGFQVNEGLMSLAKPEAVFMHCMPMERGKEVSISLPDSPRSIIFSQSKNRLHVQKALLLFLGLDKT
jgi:carbamoyl-phosphate synthase large subunit